MIRKSSFTLNFANPGKQAKLCSVLEEARRVTNVFIARFWAAGTRKGTFINLKTDTWLSARAQQACSKQALGTVKGARARKIKTLPVMKRQTLSLDSRFFSLLPGKNSFDLWVKFSCFGNKIILKTPLKKHRHFNSFANFGWKLLGGGKLRIVDGKLILDVYFEKEAPAKRTEGTQIGIDLGYKKLIATSEGQILGTEFSQFAEKIQRKKQGSKAFKRALIERDEYINRTVKKLPWASLQTLVCEDLKGLKNGRRFRKKFQAKFQRWAYPALLKRLDLTGEISGVHVHRVNPAYTSQTCSQCGEQDKLSRNGETFTCTACGWVGDADLNASVNVLRKFRLPENLVPATNCSKQD